MEEHVKIAIESAKAIVEERKQQTQFQVKLLEKISRVKREARQHKQKIAFGPANQPYDELEEQYSRNSCEIGEFHLSHV